MLNGHLPLGQPTKAMGFMDFNVHLRQASLYSCDGKTNLEANVSLQLEGASQEGSAVPPRPGPRRVRNVFEVTQLHRGWVAAELTAQLLSW